MKQYDVVKVVAIRDSGFSVERPEFQRPPQVGDVGTILEVYNDAFEVECSDGSTGITIWLSAIFPEELQGVGARYFGGLTNRLQGRPGSRVCRLSNIIAPACLIRNVRYKAMSREEIYGSFVRRFSAPRLNPVPPVTADDLHRVERELKVTFPMAYFAFLTNYGPVFTPSVLDLVTGGDSEQPPEGASFDIREFFEPSEILKTHQLYSSGGMEDWLVPVAMDCMGNVFGFKREERDSRPDDCPVFFFDHDFCKIHQEADSFDAWLASFLHLSK